VIIKRGVNGFDQQCWTLEVPEEHCSPGLEVAILVTSQGISIGDGIISWDEISKAREALKRNRE